MMGLIQQYMLRKSVMNDWIIYHYTLRNTISYATSLKLMGTGSSDADHAVDKIKSVNLAKNFLWPNKTV